MGKGAQWQQVCECLFGAGARAGAEALYGPPFHICSVYDRSWTCDAGWHLSSLTEEPRLEDQDESPSLDIWTKFMALILLPGSDVMTTRRSLDIPNFIGEGKVAPRGP
jgi:hypothetical protein